MLFQHATVFELVIGSSLMLRAWLLYHLIKDASIWRTLRPLAFHGGDKIVVEIFSLELPRFLLLLIPLGPSTRGPIFIGRLLAFPSFTAKEGTDRFLPCCVICHYIHQLIDDLRAIPT